MPPTSSSYPPPPSPPQTFHSPPITIVLTVVLLVFFLIGFFSIYFCRCFMAAILHTWHLRRTPSGHIIRDAINGDVAPRPSGSSATGLDPRLIKSFPTLVYSSIKQVRKENQYGLECAICLVEFEDDSLLRLLTPCYHVFHQECVDLWLESHKTCPVCRQDLASPPDQPPSQLTPFTNNVNGNIGDNDNNIVVIDVVDDDAVTIDVKGENYDLHDRQRGNTSKRSERVNDHVMERFPRSHSTGHSIARVRSRSEEEDCHQDRYRLRLPEHVKMKLLRGHHWTGSCETYGEFQRHRCGTSSYCTAGGRRFGEVSGSDH
ncbi:RING-H2 finger protein ATL29 [Morus notabilis]|uniref:RING-type E3 ubiquitin transferase n=1 Tax=Morus notabilis TaxID=981085 RepID=W9RCN0_9ROSA|nr:RING-H2 finger protein ATL29 [Morus notabilis]EXB64914.1 RING-H2 finger protein ATL29 [Morus notabilis]